VVAVETVCPGTLAQRLVNAGKLLLGQPRGAPGRAGAAQRLLPTVAPAGVLAADVLAGHPEGARDFGLGVAGGKQRPGLHADAFERLTVAQTAGVAAVGGWSHTAQAASKAPIMSPEEANLCRIASLALARQNFGRPAVPNGAQFHKPLASSNTR
jgi:hypothetical protein